MSAPDRRGLLDQHHGKLSIRRQCALLGLARSGVYRQRAPANDNDLAVMRRLDKLFTAWPFLGSRRMAAMLRSEGQHINRKRVQRLMRQMGIAALGPRPRTTKPAPGHQIFPYLLRNKMIDRPNQVWAADITYIPIGRGFLYLVAIIFVNGSIAIEGFPGSGGMLSVLSAGVVSTTMGTVASRL
jgi:putative transposase